jgi:diketogulonate reductase-like aldo/keto reductase
MRIAQHLDTFGFALSTDNLAAIDALDTGVQGGPNRMKSTSGGSASRSPNDGVST